MKFGPVAARDAIGGVVVHTIRQDALVLKKGTMVGPGEVEAMIRAGIREIVVARLDEGDVSENVAASGIAEAIAGEGVIVERAFTGRANLFASQSGILVVNRTIVDRLNQIDEAITFATLPAFKAVVEGEMIGTVKLVPFGIEARLRDQAIAAVSHEKLRVAPFRVKKVGVVSTMLPGLASKVIDKTIRVTQERLAPAGATIIAERRIKHDQVALSVAVREMIALGAELILVFGASAIADRRDVIPAALEEVGGHIEHFGMPVDPGNLILIGNVNDVPVVGAPGCARSPKENGFDWVLMRLLAGLKVTRDDITGMGVGGLLMEIVSRPQPRALPPEDNREVAAVILAAGRPTRIWNDNKPLTEVGGKTLVRIVAEQMLASNASSVIVVTGHQREEVEQALSGLNVTFVYNPDFAEGQGSSIRTGIGAVPETASGAVICCGDMPMVDSVMIDRMIEAFLPGSGSLIVVPVSNGRRGDPIVWSRRYFSDLGKLDGDFGARHLIVQNADAVAEVEVASQLLDSEPPGVQEPARIAAG